MNGGWWRGPFIFGVFTQASFILQPSFIQKYRAAVAQSVFLYNFLLDLFKHQFALNGSHSDILHTRPLDWAFCKTFIGGSVLICQLWIPNLVESHYPPLQLLSLWALSRVRIIFAEWLALCWIRDLNDWYLHHCIQTSDRGCSDCCVLWWVMFIQMVSKGEREGAVWSGFKILPVLDECSEF